MQRGNLPKNKKQCEKALPFTEIFGIIRSVITMEQLPKRKHPRLNNYDYTSAGAYFITICTQDRRCLLSHIVGRGLAPAEIEYTEYGKLAEQELLSLEKRYNGLKIDQYCIMPNHIHFILVLENETAGASPRPTVMDIVCAYKSLATKECKKYHPIKKLFQTSFYDHIIRNQIDYNEIAQYIIENPQKWQQDRFYSE